MRSLEKTRKGFPKSLKSPLEKQNVVGVEEPVPPLPSAKIRPVLPASGIDRRYRLAIAEYEEYIVDDEDDAYDRFIRTKGRRLVFIEYVELQ